MGQEEYQSHQFPCMRCSEDMVIGMHVNYKNLSTSPEGVENAELVSSVPGAPIINVDANFVIPEGDKHTDLAFPRLEQMKGMLEEAQKQGSLLPASLIPKGKSESRPFRRPDFGREWIMLKKSWSLHRNGRDKLSKRQIEKASSMFYASEPLDNLQDWLWRFVLFLGQPSYEPVFNDTFNRIKPLIKTDKFTDFIEFYDKELSHDRANRYFDLMRSYFSSFSEFGQVYFNVAQGREVPTEGIATSVDFDSTRMFYGNAFETFASSVDILAYLNNMEMGRRYDAFQSMTIDKYIKLDKASRFNSFSMNEPFTSLCEERDNQLRNASHHGSFRFDVAAQKIIFRSGKGGTGPEQTLSYVLYLVRCTKLFLQAMTLMRSEILMCHLAGRKPPI